MKAIIFAGGTGTRLWPLSRKKSPKQFEKILGDKSTLQLAVARLLPDFQYQDIYISTNILYKEIVENQLPQVPKENFIFEPEKKDVGPAIALVSGILCQTNPEEPIAILWSDHLVQQEAEFKKILLTAGKYIQKHHNKIIYIAHQPRYPSVNLGYIHIGKKLEELDGTSFYQTEGFKYRPDAATAQEFVKSGQYGWNLGYFVTTPKFIQASFARFSPNIYKNTQTILKHWQQPDYLSFLKKNYGRVEKINFDNAILENLDKEEALVVIANIGWSDIGAWEALKEALEKNPGDNITLGNNFLENVKDSLIYNYEDKKLVVAVDMQEIIVVNTDDVLLISNKKSVNKIKKVVEGFEGTEYEKLI